MNYYDARELQDPSSPKNGRWDYTCMNDKRIWPVGYCAGWTEPVIEKLNKTFGELTARHMLDSYEKLREHQAKYHTDGHATKEEAYECYRQFLLDNRLEMDLKLTDEQRRCDVCQEWTQGLAQVDKGTLYVLCDEHRTRAEIEKRYQVGQLISSY